MILVILNDWLWGLYAAYLKWTYPPWISFCWCECDVCHQCMASDLCDRSALGHAKSVTLSRVTQSEWPLIRCDSLHVNIVNHYSNIQYSLPMSLVWPWGVSEAATSCRQARSQGSGAESAVLSTIQHQRREIKRVTTLQENVNIRLQIKSGWKRDLTFLIQRQTFIRETLCLFVCDFKKRREKSLLPLMKIFVRGFFFHLWSWSSDWQWHQNDSRDQHARCQDASSELRRYETRNISIYNKLWPTPLLQSSVVPCRS